MHKELLQTWKQLKDMEGKNNQANIQDVSWTKK